MVRTSSIITAFVIPEVSEEASQLLSKTPPSMLVDIGIRIINHLADIFIIIGVLALLKPRELKFEKEYVVFSMLNLVIFLVCIAPPFFSPLLSAAGVDTGRLYHIALIFLAPFCVIGGITVFRVLSRAAKLSRTNEARKKWLMVLSLYFVILFLLQTGFVGAVMQNYVASPSMNQEWVKKYGDAEAKAKLYSAITLEQDVFSARWLSMNMEPGEKVYATYDDIRVHALTSYGMMPGIDVPALASTTKGIPKDAYVYLQYLNVVEGIGTEFGPLRCYNMTEISHLFAGKNKIYSNGGSEIYK